MGRVVVPLKVENVFDLHDAEAGKRKPEEIRVVTVSEALVDSGSTFLSMPGSLIRRLGFAQPYAYRNLRGVNGVRKTPMWGPVRVSVQGRFATCDVAELDEDCPVLLGQIPLEIMDWVIDMPGQKLIGNPAHGGEWVNDLFLWK